MIQEELQKIHSTLDGIRILKTEASDYEEILNILSEEFNFMSREEIARDIKDVNLSISIKAIDKDNKIIGILLFQNTDFSEYMKRVKKVIKTNFDNDYIKSLKTKKGISGTAFVISKEYRGTLLNKMFIKETPSIISGYDYVLSEVDERLKTHNYWKRMGFKEFGVFEMLVGTGRSYLYILEL